MSAIEKATERIRQLEAIPDDARFSGKDYKTLMREIVRLEYMVATTDDHLCNMMRAMQTPLKIENTPYNALLLAAKLDELSKGEA